MHNLISKRLEDEFFSQKDKKLVEKLQQLREMKETKESLSSISGIRNDAILQKLVELNVRPEELTALCLVPLVEVAWADGVVDDHERKAILSAAQKMGMKKGSLEFDLLKQWMTRKPDTDVLAAWVHYTRGLSEQLSEEERQLLKSEIMEHARSIADASGGILGLGIGNRISKGEEEVLKKVETAFCLSI
jgi:uncharacterized tellurite resistance protein B-like protein